MSGEDPYLDPDVVIYMGEAAQGKPHAIKQYRHVRIAEGMAGYGWCYRATTY